MSHIQFDGVAISVSSQSNPLFPAFTQAISHEVVGLVGRNGCGKSTLLSAIASARAPSEGTIRVDGNVEMMPQGPFAKGITVAAALGVEDAWDTITRIENGKAQGDDLDIADWTLPARVEEALAKLGLPDLDLAREAAELSGGQMARVKIASMILAQPDILLLDEPTNDLDDDGRAKVVEFLRGWDGPALVASHDRELLEHVDRIIELSPAGVLSVGGGWSAFKEQRDAERARAQADLEDAETRARKARNLHQARQERRDQHASRGRPHPRATTPRDWRSTLTKPALKRPLRVGLAWAANKSIGLRRRLTPPRSALRTWCRCGLSFRKRDCYARTQWLKRARSRAGLASAAVFGPMDISITGPERQELTGRNGSGKSSLIRILTGALPPASGQVCGDPSDIALLDQHLSLLKPEETALGAMRRCNPAMDTQAAHAALAQYGFRAAWGERIVATLSGGERVRLALACLFSTSAPPKMLILDEPTNHLDVEAIELLEQALNGYDGALLCVSHDAAFRRLIEPATPRCDGR